MIPTICPQVIPFKFRCEGCNYNTSNKKDLSKHLTTRKHKTQTNPIILSPNPIQKQYKCEDCDKSYSHMSTLHAHKKKCGIKNDKSEISSISEYEPEEYSIDPCSLSDKDLIMLLINENKEFKQIVLDQYKTIIDLAKTNVSNNHSSHNNNSLNKTFNLQFFLNEQCKDALNLSDFVSSVTMELSDLEETGRLGYVEGVSRIINKNLNKLDVYKRPIHCSDLKRETLYIKNDNKWSKDCDDNTVSL
jgi:hypothetical protein